MSWVKGQSGNISGKAKDYNGIQDLARRHTRAVVNMLSRIVRDKKAPPAARVSAGVALMDRAYGKPAAFSTASVGDFRKAVELSDDELIRIAAEAGLKLDPPKPSTVAQTAPEPKLEPAASEHLAPGALRTSTH
jgi:hypothetical protein